MGSLRRLTASFATPTQHMQQGHKQLSTVLFDYKTNVVAINEQKGMDCEQRMEVEKTYARTQTTAPTRDRITATKAKGKPIKNPRGLHSPIFLGSNPPRYDEKSLSESRTAYGSERRWRDYGELECICRAKKATRVGAARLCVVNGCLILESTRHD